MGDVRQSNKNRYRISYGDDIMPTYVEKDITSDLSPAWANTLLFADIEMSAGVATDEEREGSIPSLATRSWGIILISGLPNNDAWEDSGVQTVEIEVNAGTMDITARCRIVKLSSTGVIIESGAFTATQTMQASRVFSPVAPAWAGAEACGNRLAIEFEFVNTNTMMAATLNLGLGTLANEVITTITENSAGCVVAVSEPELVEVIA